MFKFHPNSYISCKAQGFSLVELLVSMTISLILLGGMMSLYLASGASDKSRMELADIDANAVVALRALRQIIQHAGYGTVSVEPLSKSFFTETDGVLKNPSCRDNKKLIISGSTNDNGNSGLLNPPDELKGYTKDNDDGDIITVIYRPDSPFKGELFTDCATNKGSTVTDYPNNYPYGTDSSIKSDDNDRLEACSTDTTATSDNGMPEARDAKVYSGFFLRQLSGQSKQLVCYGSRSADAEPYVIADNIENMQIRYGVRQNGQTAFKKADDISNAEWQSILSVQVALLIGSDNLNVLENPKQRSYVLLDETIEKPITDKRMYKTYSTTIYLHNVGMQ